MDSARSQVAASRAGRRHGLARARVGRSLAAGLALAFFTAVVQGGGAAHADTYGAAATPTATTTARPATPMPASPASAARAVPSRPVSSAAPSRPVSSAEVAGVITGPGTTAAIAPVPAQLPNTGGAEDAAPVSGSLVTLGLSALGLGLAVRRRATHA